MTGPRLAGPPAARRPRDVLGMFGPLARKLPFYEPREGQLQLTDAVERALDEDRVLLAEAGTGIGKTLAYLVPAMLSGRKVVISTATKALQDQIVEKDVPLLAEAAGLTVEVAVAKGLANYLCKRRFDALRKSPDATQPRVRRALTVVERWIEGTDTGDLAEVVGLPDDDPIRGEIGSSSDTRLGRACPFHDECFVTRMKARAEAARIVVTNHALFFADLALRGGHEGAALPAYDAVIFDEAHQLDDVMTATFGLAISTSRVERLVRDADHALRSTRAPREEGDRLLRHVLHVTSDLTSGGRGARGPIDGARRTLSMDEREGLAPQLFALDSALEAASGFLRRASDPEERAHETLASLSRRFDELRNDVLVIVEGGHGLVVWQQVAERRGGRASVILGASPVDVADLFRENVIETTHAVILTSATLGAGGSRAPSPSLVTSPEAPRAYEDPIEKSPFALVRRALGIDGEVDELIAPSPFDYAEQAALYLPSLPDPRDPGFLEAAREELVALVRASRGGAFVLTTSHRVLDDFARNVAPTLRRARLTVLTSGELPKHELLARFREHGDAVLLATMGFWEGVDVPGQALRLVVLDRLPFDAPTDPLVRARCERIEAAGGSAFKEYLLPSAALTLRQGFGRLLRSQRDRGLVAVLDPRLRTKGYGKTLLRSLPPARRIEQREEALAYLTALARQKT